MTTPADVLPLDSHATTADERAAARTLHHHLEVVHTLVYFDPRVAAAHDELGLELPWGGYAAGRIASMGPVGPAVATAVFHGFSPALLASALPASWERATPEEVLAATASALDETLTELLDGHADAVARAAELARDAALLQPVVGRPLGAARAASPWPGSPRLVLWEAATRIRESRGDAHVGALALAGIDGVESHITVAGDGPKVRRALQRLRGWTEAEWDAGVERLADRGLLDGDGGLTERGRDLRATIEAHTDASTVPAWRAFGAARGAELLEALREIAPPIVAAGILPGVVTRRVTPADG